MEPSRSATALTSWAAIAPQEKSWSARHPKSAVEKAGAWKPAKTKSRFPPAPTLPWKSRKRHGIPTFHRADYGFCFEQNQSKGQTQNPQGGGLKAASLCFTKRTDH